MSREILRRMASKRCWGTATSEEVPADSGALMIVRRRFPGKVRAVLQHGHSGRIGVLQDLAFHMHHHLQPLQSKAWRVV